MVSVSRTASEPHLWHLVFKKFSSCFKGDSPVPVKLAVSGSIIGSEVSSTGMVPHLGQYIIGMGVPQYLWREISQSLSLKFIFGLPIPLASSIFIISALPCSDVMPSNLPEFTIAPSSS